MSKAEDWFSPWHDEVLKAHSAGDRKEGQQPTALVAERRARLLAALIQIGADLGLRAIALPSRRLSGSRWDLQQELAFFQMRPAWSRDDWLNQSGLAPFRPLLAELSGEPSHDQPLERPAG